MTLYQCKFFTKEGRVFGIEKIVGRDDADVRSAAFNLHAHSIGGGYEVWDGHRLVERLKSPPSRPSHEHVLRRK